MKDIILTTDLYHKHADPNDHFNLAAMFALDKMKLINFAGIMCDDDKPVNNSDDPFLHFGDPSVQSIAQMNYITGRSVPVGIGSRYSVSCKEDLEKLVKDNPPIGSVDLLIRVLESTNNKVDIHMCGSCRDVLIASAMRPDLFKEKCGGIYLNAGNYGSNDPIEYNVSLEPYAFSQIFNIPCNIYWNPCFEVLTPYPYKSSERGTYYEISHEEIIPYLSDNMKKYFTYMYEFVTDVNWLSFLRSEVSDERINNWINYRNGKRQMWSTPGFLRSAGLSVNFNGELINIDDENALYGYVPINVKCSNSGEIHWNDTDSSHIYMFKNKDADAYANAMPKAINKLFSVL